MNPRVSVAAPLGCALGEGLHWDGRRGLLWLVDILNQELIWFDPKVGVVGRRGLPEPIGWVLALTDSDRVLIGLKSGIALVDPFDIDRPIEWLDRSFPGRPDLRLNDAKVDKFGRVWAGAMSAHDDVDVTGSLAHYDVRLNAWKIVDAGYLVPNGPAFNAECSIMLHSDSARGTVYRYELDPDTGTLKGRTIWRVFPPEEGLPDGMTFDAEGFVWIAHWGAGQVCRYDPLGRLDVAISMPTSQVTNVCFGGDSMERLFVTSASHGLSGDDPHAGSLFEIHDVGVRGLTSWQVPLS